MSNQEVQDARKEATNGLGDILKNRTTYAIKRRGEIDSKAFLEACSFKFSGEELQTVSCEMCSKWQEELKDAKWHPFKKKVVNGQLQEVIDEDDEKLKEWRSEYGEAAYEVVANALLELEEYNPSGRYVVPEIWNTKEKTKASLKEIVSYLTKQLKTMKSNKRQRSY